MEGADETAVMARKKIQGAPNWSTRIMAFLVGVAASIGPVATAWYEVKQAKIEAAAAREASKKEANIGYETLANPLEKFRAAITILDWRVQRLEDQQGSRMSIGGPITPEPLAEPALKRPVPQTLMEADAIGAPKK
jgi:hypothetical protein